MKTIISATKCEAIVLEQVPLFTGLVIAYMGDIPYKLHRIHSQWAFIELGGSECYADGLHSSAKEAMESILKLTPKLIYYDSLCDFVVHYGG